MQEPFNRRSVWLSWRCTVLVLLILVVLNFDLCFGTRSVTGELAESLEFDGVAIRRGEMWRVLTSNFVHWSRAHFYLDAGVFLVLGLVYEPVFRRSFPWLVLTTALAAGAVGVFVWPPEMRCRGLSGVDSGLFAAALVAESRLALRERIRWLWVGPAAAIFIAKNVYEVATGQSFFSTERLLGPAKLATAAHAAAIVAALAFCSVLAMKRFRLHGPITGPHDECRPRAE